jgi:predicted ATPase
LHLAIGKRLESAFGQDSLDIAAELGRHFEGGQESGRAFSYLRAAGEQAARRNAYDEAIGYYRRDLALLSGFPDRAERLRLEHELQAALGALLAMTSDGVPS